MNYITRCNDGVAVYDNNLSTYNKGLKAFINMLCLGNLSTFEGREKASAFALKRKSTLPVYINKDILLFPTESIRNYSCIYINYINILSIKERDYGLTKVIFSDLSVLDIDVSITKMKKQVKRAQTIIDYKIKC